MEAESGSTFGVPLTAACGQDSHLGRTEPPVTEGAFARMGGVLHRISRRIVSPGTMVRAEARRRSKVPTSVSGRAVPRGADHFRPGDLLAEVERVQQVVARRDVLGRWAA